jgi:hypothetical protein
MWVLNRGRMHDRPTGDWRLDWVYRALSCRVYFPAELFRQNRLLSKRPLFLHSYHHLDLNSSSLDHVYISPSLSSPAGSICQATNFEDSNSGIRVSSSGPKLPRETPLDHITNMEKSYQNLRSKGIEGCIQAGGRECRLR